VLASKGVAVSGIGVENRREAKPPRFASKRGGERGLNPPLAALEVLGRAYALYSQSSLRM